MKNRRLFSILFVIVAAMLIMPSYTSAQGTWLWLHDEPSSEHPGALIMDGTNPGKMDDSRQDLNLGAVEWLTYPFQSDQKIYGDVTVSLFLEAYFLRTDLLPLQLRVVRVFLVDVSSSGSEDEIGSTIATPIFFLSNDTIKQKSFTIKNVDYTIPSGHSLGIRVERTIDLLSYFPFSMLSPFFSTNVVYDSTTHPSSVRVPFNQSQGGIELDCYPQQKSVKAGGEVTYDVSVWNKGSSNETVTLSSDYSGEWDVDIDPTTVNIDANYLNYSSVKVTAPSDAQPGDFLNITIRAQGTTGSDSIWLNTTVAAPTYGVDITAPSGKDGKPGDTITYTFTVKNTGDLKDSYSLSASSTWQSSLDKHTLILLPGESGDVTASVDIPSDAENNSNDKLTVTVQSQNSSKSDSASVTTTAVLPGGGGGEEKSSSKIPSLVLFVLFLIGITALVIVVIFITDYARRYVSLSCDERMKEIPPGYSADYRISVTNTLEKIKGGKNRLNYRLAVGGDIPEGWRAEIDKEVMTLDGGESAEVTLHVEAPEDASMDEWASVDVMVKPIKKRSKGEKVNIVTLLRNP
ncbi:MAG TPA: hypothetical protein ENL18_02715, partial [Thermoplasmatales archaeon]|nr:hypothetical protein [Thermoplasmatales archaeon]